MRITTKGRYALRIMVDLARHMDEPHTPLSDIAKREGISLKYMETIVGMLSRAGFVSGSRGKYGGYHLNRPPEEYTLAAILKLTEGSLAPVSCLDEGQPVCPMAGQCDSLPVWQGLERVVNDYLAGITVADLARQQAERGGPI